MKEIILNYVTTNILNGDEGEPLTADDDLLSSGLVDSLGIMKIVGFVEEEFKITIPPGDLVIENFISAQAMENYIKTQQ